MLEEYWKELIIISSAEDEEVLTTQERRNVLEDYRKEPIIIYIRLNLMKEFI